MNIFRNRDGLYCWVPAKLGGDVPRRDLTGYKLHNALSIAINPIWPITITCTAILGLFTTELPKDMCIMAILSFGTITAGCIAIRRRISKRRLSISKWDARSNNFKYKVLWLPSRYSQWISNRTVSKSDAAMTVALYRHFGEGLISLGLYTPVDKPMRIDLLSGKVVKQISVIEYCVCVYQETGTGYIVIEPFGWEKDRVASSVDAALIQRALRDIGLTEWTVSKLISYDDDVYLFILTDNRSSAYDFEESWG